MRLNKGDGPNSTTIFDNLQLANDQRSGKNNTAKYKGVIIIVMKDGRYEYSTNSAEKTTNTIAEFKVTLEKAKHEKTAIGDVERQLEDFGSLGVRDVSQDDVVSILSSVEEQLSNRFAELEDDVLEVRRGGLTKAEVDELIGVLSFDRTGTMSPEDQIKTLAELKITFNEIILNDIDKMPEEICKAIYNLKQGFKIDPKNGKKTRCPVHLLHVQFHR